MHEINTAIVFFGLLGGVILAIIVFKIADNIEDRNKAMMFPVYFVYGYAILAFFAAIIYNFYIK
jgi:ABC-type antimicrobial peptide transport system permease subunit